MKIRISFDLDNAAFTDGLPDEGDAADGIRDGDEIASVLRELADKIAFVLVEEGDHWALKDSNGNRIGDAEITL